jgi:hypothetical protein
MIARNAKTRRRIVFVFGPPLEEGAVVEVWAVVGDWVGVAWEDKAGRHSAALHRDSLELLS